MRIGIDVRCLAEGRRTGVEEYTLNLLENLFRIDTRNEYILFFNSFRKSRADFSGLIKFPNVKLKRFNFPNKILNFLFWYLDWPKIDRLVGGVDIFFLSNIIFGSYSQKTKLVATIHDLSFERYPETFSWKRRVWHIFINPKKICQKASKIIAVSDSTKNDLVEVYGIKSEKIERIYSGISEKFKLLDRNNENLIKIKEKYNLPYKFILYLGTIEPRKNIIGIVRAYNRLQEFAQNSQNEELKKHKLVLAGQFGWLHEEIFDEIRQSKYKENIFHINYVADADKVYIYNLASIFVYPSFFEGFGFPPLEAMSCGVPVVSSNNSSLSEVIGQGGILIDPDKPEEIFEAMKAIIFSKDLQDKLREEGMRQRVNFNWNKTAQDLLKLFSKLGK